ncbi:MAG: hypothetical protein K2Q12_05730, partial [Rickettsiales bacterium]|nr:hypothetical protein [Rickettsiales bacterium]
AQPVSEALAILLNMDGLDGESYAALGTLQGISEEGMPSSLELKKQFNRSLQDYLSREVSPTQSGGLWADMRDRLGSLVHVRKVGAQHRGDDDASIIARSEAFIETQALDKAVKEMAMLSGDAAPHFHQWRMQARQRLKTLATFKTLEQRLQRGR